MHLGLLSLDLMHWHKIKKEKQAFNFQTQLQPHCCFSQKLASLNETAILHHRVTVFTLSREVNPQTLSLLAYLQLSLQIKLLLKGTGHGTSYPECLISTVPHSFSSNEFSMPNSAEMYHVEPRCCAAVVKVGGERNNQPARRRVLNQVRVQQSKP